MKYIFQAYNRFINTLYTLSIPANQRIIINACITQHCKTIKQENFGDDLNYYLIEALTGKAVINVRNTFLKQFRNYMVIGSILDGFCFPNTEVWGAGVISDKQKLKCKPKQIYAVRGKLTRKYLLDNNIPCPEIYGDPALLLPLLYQSNAKKIYRVGIVPHIVDWDTPLLQEFIAKSNGATIINLGKYKDVKDIVEQFNQCEIILSSSLHGLIVADAYGIPNRRIKLSDRITGGDFKYNDYYSGIERKITPPNCINSLNDFYKAISDTHRDWRPILFDSTKFMNACPFTIKELYQ